MKTKISTAMLTRLALMTAASMVLLLLVRIPFPPAPFLVYDPADMPIYITAFAFGPIAGLLVTVVVSLLQAFALGGDGLYGFLMHVVATGIVAVVIGAMYSRKKTKKQAIKALVVGTITTVVAMCGMNLLITPLYMGVPTKAVLAMIPTVIIPFNALKAGINSLLTFLLYKKISGFLHQDTLQIKKNKK